MIKKKHLLRKIVIWQLLIVSLLMLSLNQDSTTKIIFMQNNSALDENTNPRTSDWSHIQVISDGWNGTKNWNLADSRDPAIAVDNKGNVHVVWEDDTDLADSGDDREIMYANYTPSKGWSHAVVISDCWNGTNDWNTGDSISPAIAIDKSDNIHVVWVDDTNLGASGIDLEIMYTNRTANGANWLHAVVISDCWNGTDDWNTGFSFTPDIALDSNDNIHVVWQDGTDLARSGDDFEIMYTNRTANGANWLHAVVISDCWNGTNDWNNETSGNCRIAIDNSDNVHVVWADDTDLADSGDDREIMYSNRSATGANWLHAVVISDCWNGTNDWNTGGSYVPDIAIDKSDNIHVVWADDTNLGASGIDSDVFYTNRTATGASWLHPVVISDCWNGTNDWNTELSNWPDIAIDNNDNIHIVWYDDTDLVDSGDDTEIMYSKRSATGANWLHPVVISDCWNGTNDWNTDNSMCPRIAINSSNNIYIVWYDDTDLLDSGNDREIFYTRIINPINQPFNVIDDRDDEKDDEIIDNGLSEEEITTIVVVSTAAGTAAGVGTIVAINHFYGMKKVGDFFRKIGRRGVRRARKKRIKRPRKKRPKKYSPSSKSAKHILNKLSNKDKLLKIFDETVPFVEVSPLMELDLSVVLEDFVLKVDQIGFNEGDQLEFIREMLAFTPSEREEIISNIFKRMGISTFSNTAQSGGET